jgi:hypothetical protein
VRAGQGDRAAALAQPVDRLPVEEFGGSALAHERARARLDREQRGTWAYYSLRRDALDRLSTVFEVKEAVQ